MLGVEGGYANCYNDLCQKIVFVHRLMSVCAPICILVKLWIHFHKCLWEGWAKGPTDYLDVVCYSITQLLVKSGYALVMILLPRRLCTL